VITQAHFARVLAALDHIDPAVYAEHLAPDFVFEMPGLKLNGPAAYHGICADWALAFPDLSHTLVSFLAEGDRYAAEIEISGTHRGPFNGLPASGRRFAVLTATLGDFAGDQMSTRRVYFDPADMSRQLVS
jgi:predicted ester cyclase